MIFNKKLFRESTYKILTVLFLIGYNFTPPILAANEIFNFGSISDKLNVSQEIDTSEDILDEGISDPKWIAKGDNYSSQSVDSKLSTKSSAAFAAGGSCILDVEPSMGKLNCTADDVPTVIPTVNLIQGCNAPGDIAKFDLTLSVGANASDRYDIGLWVSKDGDPNKDSSETGMCQTFVFDKATYGDGDFCGDVQSRTMVTKTFSNIELVCRDDDGDGRLDVPVITTWRNSSNPNDCPSADRALPETKSKCKNDETFNIPVPIPGQIIVKKVTNPVDDNQEFDFFLTGPKSSFFSLKNNGIWDSGKVGTGGLPEGTYSLNETNPTNWKLDDVTCTSSFDDKETYSNISLQSGETVTCTFTNVKQTANLTVVKDVVKDNGGTAGVDDFGISVNGTAVTSGTKGSYAVGEALTINEIGLTGYSFVSITGDSKCPTSLGGTITLEPGDDITCTIINDDIAPKLTLNKVVVNDNGGILSESAWNLFAKQGETVVLTGSGATGETDVVSGDTFKAGTYTLSESGPTGYSASDWVCVGGIQNGNNITVGLNENVVCTITNNDIAPKLTVTKVVVDGLFGTKSISDFPLFVGTTPVTSGAQNSFNAGSHTVSETNQEGYTSVISGDCDANGNVTLALGDTKACTITNTSIWSQIIVKKLVAPTTDLTKFTFTGGLEGSIGHNETISKIVLPGTYSVSETLPTGWALTDLICSDTDSTVDKTTGTATYVVGNNEGVTCTYTNTKLGSISGHKWVDADGLEGTANDRTPVSGWTIFIDFDEDGIQDEGETRITDENGYYEFTNLLPGIYTVKEIFPLNSGWYYLIVSEKTVKYVAGINVENVNFVNVEYGSIKVLKNVDGNGDGDLLDDVDIIGSTDWSWTINDTNAGSTGTTKSNLTPGTYTIKETGGSKNFHIVSLNCTGSTGITIDDSVATVSLKSGEDVVCTYTNARDLGTLIVKKVVINDNGGSLEAKDFSFQIDKGAEIVFEADGQNEFTKYAGLTYDIVELNPNTRGYTTTYDKCHDVLVPYNQTVTCTITNNDNAPVLELAKSVVNDNGGTLSSTNWNLKADGPTPINGDGGVISGSTFQAGTYTLSEIGKTDVDVSGYLAGDWSCDGGTLIGNEVVVPFQGNVKCTIVNDDIAPKLTLVKDPTNDNGGNAQPNDFLLTIGGNAAVSGTAYTLDANKAYAINETLLPGYEFVSITGTGCPAVLGGTVMLNEGDDITCTITNNDIAPTLTVIKNVVNDNGGSAVVEDFDISLDSSELTFETGVINGTTTTYTSTQIVVSNHSYTLTEIDFTGYTGGTWSCIDDSDESEITIPFTLSEGQNVTCTITNDDIAPKLTVTKVVENGPFGDKEIADFPLFVGEEEVTSGVQKTFFADDYTVSETNQPGYTSSFSGDCNEKTGEITLNVGDVKSCTITNTSTHAKIALQKITYPVIEDVEFEFTGDMEGMLNHGEKIEEIVVPGEYTITETQKDGWYISDVECNDGESKLPSFRSDTNEITFNAEANEDILCIVTNSVIDPLLQIQKSNDTHDPDIDQFPGDQVLYTIIVTAPTKQIVQETGLNLPGKYIVKDVVVSDIAPSGFKYVSNSWTANSSVKGNMTITEPVYDGNKAALWNLGDMEEGEVITLTYKTIISLLTDSGTYPDIAWVKGKSVANLPVLGNISTGATTPFVGTDVTVIEPMETEEGEVLGATTYLPNTGSSTYLTFASLITMILGFVTLLLSSQKKYFKKLALSFVLLFLIFPSSAFAFENLIVKIEEPKSPTGNQSFNIDFTAQDINEESIGIECYKNDVLFFTLTGNSGSCPVTVETSGTYTFFVKAKTITSEVQSATVTVVVDLATPLPVVDYAKTNNVLQFKTADDGRSSMVEIFRSDKSSFLANSSTLIHTMPVVPNTEYTYTDTTAESGKPYFYAIRAVDSLGNVSTIVSDKEVIILPVSTGTTSVTVVANAQGQETATGSEDEGEVAGEKDIDVNGEVEGEKDGNIDEVEATEELTESIKNNWIFWVIGIVALGGIVYIYVQRTKKNK
mgnify:CR=1 FL=1